MMSEVRALKFYIKEAIMNTAALKVVKHFVVTNLTTEEASAPQRLNVPLILNTVCNTRIPVILRRDCLTV